ncbi:prepilin-type N-terminal cleavage/methylation domain-containing protein [Rickettsiales bacterium]|nr:prepilin-type N-terminal cleavage/methylation domain-containing protein [Rickettsiales bacterium]
MLLFCKKTSKNKNGFSLVELSIVIVVISLIVSGVLVGQDLVKKSRLQAVVGDIKKIKYAVDSFTDYYGQLPGDLSKASFYWGSSCVSTGVCNGDGNGIWTLNTEGYRAWNHMNLAGMFPNTLSGLAGSYSQIGVNVYQSKFPKAGYEFGVQSGRSNVMAIFAHRGSLDGSLAGPIFTPKQAEYIDMKMDDGWVNTGIIYGTNGTNPAAPANCHDLSKSHGYNVASESVNCGIYVYGFGSWNGNDN